jgi:hypothetical protein
MNSLRPHPTRAPAVVRAMTAGLLTRDVLLAHPVPDSGGVGRHGGGASRLTKERTATRLSSEQDFADTTLATDVEGN